MRRIWIAAVSMLGPALIAVAKAGAGAVPETRESELAARIQLFERSLRPAVVIEGEVAGRWGLQQRMAHHHVPGVSIAVVRDGRLLWARGYGVKLAGGSDPIDTETVFSVGSLSKVASAAITLRLVASGRLSLDRDVNEALRRWRVPESGLTKERRVTLRGILSHTAGFNVYGFDDFLPGEPLPTVFDTLTGRAPARNEPVQVTYVPGTQWSYSGGGVTAEQLIVEDVMQAGFADAARLLLFEPLGMRRSTFINPLPASTGNIARAHDERGKPAALPRGWEAFPEMAASGLWTTPSDYARLLIALIESYRGAPRSFINEGLAREMMTEVGPSPFGLGPALGGRGATHRFFHDGANDSYRAWMEGHLSSGDGLVVFTNGAGGAELFREIRRAVAVSEGWPLPAPIRREDVPAPVLNEYVGLYETVAPAGFIDPRIGEYAKAYRVQRHGKALRFSSVDSGTEVDLVGIDPGHFVGPNAFFDYSQDRIEVSFPRGYDGAVQGLVLGYGDQRLEARKDSVPVPASAPAPQESPMANERIDR